MSWWRFKSRGGVRLRFTKGLPSRSEPRFAALPPTALIPVGSNPDALLVREGSQVSENQPLSRSGPARAHASVPGVVKSIREIDLPFGKRSLAVEIETGGRFSSLDATVPVDFRDMTRSALIDGLMDKGVHNERGLPLVMRGNHGALPSAVNFIVNLAPFTSFDACATPVWWEVRAKIAVGAAIMRAIYGAERVHVCVSPKDVVRASELANEVRAASGAKLETLVIEAEPRYPMADAKIVTSLIKEKPSADAERSAIPVFTAADLKAVYDAIVLNKPVIERMVIVAGDAVRTPSLLSARVGSSYGFLFEECGGLQKTPSRVICGEPLTGSAVVTLDMPVTSSTSMILALGSGVRARDYDLDCLRCGECVGACPMGLVPSEIYGASSLAECVALGIRECVACGACAYVCPARLSLTKRFRVIQRRLERGETPI